MLIVRLPDVMADRDAIFAPQLRMLVSYVLSSFSDSFDGSTAIILAMLRYIFCSPQQNWERV